MLTHLSTRLVEAWYGRHRGTAFLRPLSALYALVTAQRRAWYQRHPDKRYRAAVPVVVVGNLTAGGTGKTPLTLALARALQAEGLKVAIASRGHGGSQASRPLEVKPSSDPALCGDEPLLLARHAGCPVVVDPRRARAVQHIEARFAPDLVLCDDGLQHYALERDVEIVVIDGSRGFGNGRLLPEGPLREPVARLADADFIVINGLLEHSLPALELPRFLMQLQPLGFCNLATGERLSVADFRARFPGPVQALSGIGNPARFHQGLEALGFVIMPQVFPDHHAFRPADLDLPGSEPVLMTEKDAVKCQTFASERCWYLAVEAVLPPELIDSLLARLRKRAAPDPAAAT